jgi:endonuclease YncB( thermonuclease family)
MIGRILSTIFRPAIRFPPEKGPAMILLSSAVDGDTVKFFFLVEATGRLAGIDAPERSTPEGIAARAYLQALLPAGPVDADLRGREKYGRTLLTFPDATGRDVCAAMVDAGMAKAYDGRGPRP